MVHLDVEQASDANLVVAVGRWHEPALAEIYRRHGGAVHALARRILRSDPPAEEVTQEVFLDLWRSPEKFDAQRGSPAVPSCWPGRTASRWTWSGPRSHAADARSRPPGRRRPPPTTSTARSGTWPWPSRWRDALGALPDELRQPIELAYFGGRTYKEVAVLLDEPEGTVKSRIRSGLGRLHVNLTERGIEPAGAGL